MKYTIDENTKDITETIAGSFSQYPLKTAWAITIHKSQGLTFEHAIIDASAAFSHGQVYVALSRCKTLEGMVLSSPITRNAMISDEKILSYTSSLSERQPCEDQLRQAQQQYYLRLATELFDFNPVQQSCNIHLTRHTPICKTIPGIKQPISPGTGLFPFGYSRSRRTFLPATHPYDLQHESL